ATSMSMFARLSRHSAERRFPAARSSSPIGHSEPAAYLRSTRPRCSATNTSSRVLPSGTAICRPSRMLTTGPPNSDSTHDPVRRPSARTDSNRSCDMRPPRDGVEVHDATYGGVTVPSRFVVRGQIRLVQPVLGEPADDVERVVQIGERL